jgi:4-hydroxybenzoate polyprenyltransferase
MRFDRPVGTLLVLWPTLWGLWLAAEGMPDFHLLVIFILGSITMRAAGCAINDYADRDFDAHVERTKNRPLATGELEPKQALYCFFAASGFAVFLVLLTNPLTMAMAAIGAILTSLYPFLKRWTYLPQIWLGLAMNWGIVMAYTAQSGQLTPGIGVFYCAAICWTVAYDTCYAMVDRDDDIKLGVKSIAILFGEQDKMMIGILQALTLAALYIGGQRFEFNSIYFWSLLPVIALFAYQQWLIRDRSRAGSFSAFINNKWLGPIVLIAIWLGQI